MDGIGGPLHFVLCEFGAGRVLAFTGLGSPIHWIVIGIAALLLFGNRLPEVARSLGKAWNEFKRGLHDVSDELDREPTDAPPRQKLQAPEDDDSQAARRFAEGETQKQPEPEEQRVNEND
ncbi:MAG: twin-arginine translocase TatA/TatE family subunit [Phycisphaerae bacterium]|nr:twin-arginine translocase TatA/TatE family subunit [Phycisphaerae bacterium]